MFRDCTRFAEFMQEEFIELVDEIAAKTVTDQHSFQAIQEQITPKTLPNIANPSKLDENNNTMPAPSGVHVSRHVLDQFMVLLEQQQTPHVWCCVECILSFDNGKCTQNELVDKRIFFLIPSIEAIKNYIGQTPIVTTK
jgi:hypothetical protein